MACATVRGVVLDEAKLSLTRLSPDTSPAELLPAVDESPIPPPVHVSTPEAIVHWPTMATSQSPAGINRDTKSPNWFDVAARCAPDVTLEIYWPINPVPAESFVCVPNAEKPPVKVPVPTVRFVMVELEAIKTVFDELADVKLRIVPEEMLVTVILPEVAVKALIVPLETLNRVIVELVTLKFVMVAVEAAKFLVVPLEVKNPHVVPA